MAVAEQVDPREKMKGNSADLEWSANADLGALLIKMSVMKAKTFPWPPCIWINEIFRPWVFSPCCPGGSVISLSCEVHQCLFISTKQAAEAVDIFASQSQARLCRMHVSLYSLVSVVRVLLNFLLWSHLFDHCFSLRTVTLSINIHVEFQPDFHLKLPTADCRWPSGPWSVSWSVDWEAVSSPRTETIKPLHHVSRIYGSCHFCSNSYSQAQLGIQLWAVVLVCGLNLIYEKWKLWKSHRSNVMFPVRIFRLLKSLLLMSPWTPSQLISYSSGWRQKEGGGNGAERSLFSRTVYSENGWKGVIYLNGSRFK